MRSKHKAEALLSWWVSGPKSRQTSGCAHGTFSFSFNISDHIVWSTLRLLRFESNPLQVQPEAPIPNSTIILFPSHAISKGFLPASSSSSSQYRKMATYPLQITNGEVTTILQAAIDGDIQTLDRYVHLVAQKNNIPPGAVLHRVKGRSNGATALHNTVGSRAPSMF